MELRELLIGVLIDGQARWNKIGSRSTLVLPPALETSVIVTKFRKAVIVSHKLGAQAILLKNELAELRAAKSLRTTGRRPMMITTEIRGMRVLHARSRMR